jgi:GTP cyclohydrolase FolE2
LIIDEAVDLIVGDRGSIEVMARRLREVQGAEKSYVTLSAQKSLKKNTRVTKKETHDKIFLYAKASITPTSERRDIGLSAFNMTACPCTWSAPQN